MRTYGIILSTPSYLLKGTKTLIYDKISVQDIGFEFAIKFYVLAAFRQHFDARLANIYVQLI